MYNVYPFIWGLRIDRVRRANQPPQCQFGTNGKKTEIDGARENDGAHVCEFVHVHPVGVCAWASVCAFVDENNSHEE